MSKKEVNKLKKNKYVKTVSNKSITYTDEFKEKVVFETENYKKFPRQVFEECGFDIDVIGIKRTENAAYKWRKQYKEQGELKDSRKGKSGRPLERELSDAKKLKRAEAKIHVLEAENELLKLSENITLEMSVETVKELKKNKHIILNEKVKLHSDQGSHYTSPTFHKLLKKYNIEQSMSRRGNCWDNAPQESFFGHMKDELHLDNCLTFNDVKQEIKDYIDYYNNYRYQWNLKKMTPVMYRNHLLKESA